DPIGAVLAVIIFEMLLHAGDGAVGVAVLSLGRSLFAGGVIGWFISWVLVQVIRNHWVPDYLHAPVAVGLVLVGFAASNFIQPESGLITVTLAGILLANQKHASVKHILEFEEIMRTMLISVLFIVLSARLPLDHVSLVINPGSIVFILLLLFVIRPAAVYASTLKSELKRNERVFIAWLAPRGIVAAAVTSIFALELVKHGVVSEELANQLVLYVFLVVISTVAIYGLTAATLARRLKLASKNPQGLVIAGADRLQLAIGKAMKAEGYDVLVVDTNWQNISAARMAGLQTFYGSVLSEYAMDRMELDGKGRLLAMTRNDELNALAVQHFHELFGRVNTYQLAMGGEASERYEKLGMHMRGRLLFDKEATFDHLQQRVVRGGVIRATPMSDEFDFQDFLQQYADKALPLALIKENGDLVIWTAESPPSPKSGQKVLALIEESDNTRMVKAISRRNRKTDGKLEEGD
ncbi:MAG: cation:proton antiporter, partial [Planctomycetota bacterium]